MRNEISGVTYNYIRLARALAVIMIFTCHIFQYYGSFLAFHFNTGVYVFLMISGILFSKKDLNNPVNFYLKRAKRILVPYYLYILILVVINIMQNNDINISSVFVNVFCIQWFFTGIDKAGHLWYISAYLICCLFTPLLYRICSRFKDKSLWYYLILVLLMLIIQIIGRIFSINLFSLCAYILSYCISFKFKDINFEHKIYLKVLMFIGFFLEIVRLKIDIFGGIYKHIISNTYGIEITKILFSISILLLCYFWGNKLTKIDGILKWFDKYSYSVYLTHHLWILGTLSVLNFTKNILVNIFIAIMLTIIFAIVLQNISNFIINRVYKK